MMYAATAFTGVLAASVLLPQNAAATRMHERSLTGEWKSGGSGGVTIDSGVFESSATCMSEASAVAEVESTEHTAIEATGLAIADAFNILCSPAGEIKPKAIELIFTDAAESFAAVMVSAEAKAICSTTGENASACASGAALAAAWATANAEAWVTAYAAAEANCAACENGELTGTTSEASVSTADFVELVSEAYSVADIVVCVAEDDDYAFGQAVSGCVSEAYVKLTVNLIAEALVSGGCTDANTEAFVEAATAIEYTTKVACEEETTTYGPQYAGTDMGGDAGVTNSAAAPASAP